MRTDDVDLELFRRAVSCGALLERWPAGWRLDRQESTGSMQISGVDYAADEIGLLAFAGRQPG